MQNNTDVTIVNIVNTVAVMKIFIAQKVNGEIN